MKKIFLEADPNQVEIKKLLGKDFLELSMRTVSSANPNRNGSWFTKEAQEKALASYDDRPILAYFTNGDFVSHDGEWKNDSETGMDFWDTLGARGERPIGTIRGKDKKQVVYDEATGLYWTEITCALWTQYSYRQVKRLIEDAKAAALTGGPTKSISVEVDINDYEELPNGVLKINDYTLQGITILGSRNGKKVEPGIEGAQLSVLDVISNGLYEKQRHALMQAYERLDTSLKQKEEMNMNLDKDGNPIEPTPTPTEPTITPTEPTDPTTTTANFEGDPTTATTSKTEPTDPEPKLTDPVDPEGGAAFSAVGEPEAPAPTKADVICDLAWLIESLSYRLETYDNTIKHYEEVEEMPGKNLVIATLKRMRATAEAEISDLGKLLALITAEDFVEDAERENFEAELCKNCHLSEVYAKLLESEKECNELKEKCSAYEAPCPECGQHPCVCEKKKYEALKAEYDTVKEEKEKLEFEAFMSKASTAIEGAKGSLTEEVSKAIFERCEKKEIVSLEALETELALAAGKIALANKEAKTAYSAPIPTYETPLPKAAEASKDPFVRMGYKGNKK